VSGRILLTGGSGRLGRELRALLPDVVAPSHSELDITDPDAVARTVQRRRPATIVHAAAYTDVAAAERDRDLCRAVNVEGTRNVARAARAAGALLVHISTDYVFEGSRGGYREEDPTGPARNVYAQTKLEAESAAREAGRVLILRTSFRPREWPYPIAFTDVFTSQDYVDVIAPELALAIRAAAHIPHDVLHIATERKSVYELARRRRPDVRPGSRRDAPVELPADVSLDTTRWQALRPRLVAALAAEEAAP
jgi:dTDP-4-dehydrorhamnose reductase